MTTDPISPNALDAGSVSAGKRVSQPWWRTFHSGIAWLGLAVAILALLLSLRNPGSQPVAAPVQVLQRLDALEAAGHATADQSSRVEPATASVIHREAVPPGGLAQATAQIRNHRLVLTAIQLGIKTRGHRPFQRELELLRRIGQDDPRLRAILDNLAPHAVTGVATVTELRDAFGVILLPKLQVLGEGAERSWSKQAQDWWDAAVGNDAPPLAAEPDQPYRLIAAAVERLTEDDLQAAVELLTRLDGASAALVARWLAEARARLTVDSAYDSLSETVARFLEQGGEP